MPDLKDVYDARIPNLRNYASQDYVRPTLRQLFTNMPPKYSPTISYVNPYETLTFGLTSTLTAAGANATSCIELPDNKAMVFFADSEFNSGANVTYSIIDNNNNILTDKVHIANSSNLGVSDCVELGNGNILVGYRSNMTARGIVVNTAGEVVVADKAISSVHYSTIGVTALTGGGAVVAGYDSNNVLMFDILDNSANIVVSETVTATNTSTTDVVGLADGNFMLLYADTDNGGALTYQVYTSIGTQIVGATVLDSIAAGGGASNEMIDAIVLQNNNVGICYAHNGVPYFMIVNQSGGVVVNAIQLSAFGFSYVTCSLLPNGNVFVAWRGTSTWRYSVVASDGTILKASDVNISGSAYGIDSSVFTNGDVLVIYYNFSDSLKLTSKIAKV